MTAPIFRKFPFPPLTLMVAIHSQQARNRLADLLRAHFFSSLRTPHDIGDQWEMYLLDRRLQVQKEKNSFLAVSWEFVVDTLH